MLDSLSQREKVLLLVALFFVLGAGYYMFLYTPLQDEISYLESSVSSEEDALFQEEMLIRQYQHLQEQYEEKQAEYEALKEALPEEVKPAEFLYEMESVAEEKNVQFHAFRPGTVETREGNYGRANFSLSIQGTFEETLKFVTALEEHELPIEIRDLSLNPSRDRDWVDMGINVVNIFRL